MYAEAGERHNVPHFHVRYGEHKATFEIESGDLMVGYLPKSQMRLVEAWAELHRAELKADWAMLLSGQAPRKIAPLS
ncbi:MAG: hypothetical protein HDKAJFGB_01315 [Anaerolineae bacterium]|nr:hypothetical protein [Anaerolineae bacterium]